MSPEATPAPAGSNRPRRPGPARTGGSRPGGGRPGGYAKGPRKPFRTGEKSSKPGEGPPRAGGRPLRPSSVGKEFITPSRLEAAKALLKIEKGAKVADVLEVKGLIPEDMALLRELVYGVTRQKRILDYQLGKLCQSPFEKLPIEVRISLRMGLYQLMYLTRIPAHAAVHETVNLVKAGGQEALAGFTNAVLRNAETKRAEFTVEGESEKDTLALRYSHPTWMVKRWAAVYPPETLEKILEANNQPHPVFLRTRPGKSEQVQELLKTQQIRVEPLVWPPDTLKLVSHEGGLFTGDSFQQGDWFVQDWSPQAMLELLPFEKVSRAWDVCAAPGGKTAGLSWKIDQKGEVWATDFSPIRREKLKENIKRLGLANVKFFEDPIERLSPAQKFDLIWVDAPCSGTGVLSRRADLRWKLKREEIKNHAEEQLKLMEEVQGHLYPKGFVVYTTCSLETEENQSLVQAFLTKHPDWAPMPLASPMELESVDKSEWGMTFLPTKDRDGGFLSVLQKK